MSKLVSVIIPIFNVENYLNRCIESIVNQTYKNIEIILVDDGSNDKSGMIAEQWKTKDSRIFVYHKENGGLSDARNYGIKYATGYYISFVDADDCVNIHFIERLIFMMDNYDVEISAIGFRMFYNEVPQLEYDTNYKIKILDKKKALEALFLQDGYQNFAWNKLYLKSLFFDVKYPIGKKMEDLGTTYLLIDKCNKIAYDSIELYYYFQRDDSILHQINDEFYVDKYQLIKERYAFIRKKYPDMMLNCSVFFEECLRLYPYQSDNEKKWIDNELEKLWEIIKNKIKLKQRIKYYLFRYVRILYFKINN